MKTPITFAKIVATPTPSSWSQAYNAGNLAAVISLVQEPIDSKDQAFSQNLSLPSLGKELLNTLEAEYFTIETKNLETIKQAVLTTCEKLTGPVVLSFCVSVIIENILYVFLYGKGHVLMKRAGKLGRILKQEEDKQLLSGSGFIENGDIVILETAQFHTIVPEHLLLPCLEHDKLSEMAEILSPVIHNKQEGAAAALAFSYQEKVITPALSEKRDVGRNTMSAEDFTMTAIADAPQKNPEHAALANADNFSQVPQEEFEKQTTQEKDSFVSHPQRSQDTKGLPISHPRRLFLTIAIILAIVLIASVYFAIKKQQDKARQAYFASAIVPAQKKYDEGQSLMDLNQSLARDDFESAKQMLTPLISKLPANSKEAKDAQALLAKISDAINHTAQQTFVDARPADASESPFLSAFLNNSSASYVGVDGNTTYLANNNGIISIKNGQQKTTLTNSGDWTTIGGFGVYLGNFYILDKKDGISKYTGGKSPKSAYFTKGVSPDLSQATDIAIDGSIWVLTTDGTITKYTRGTLDTFSLKGLDKPFIHPSRIVTSADDTNIYILDKGNNRVVVLDKNGTYLAQYASKLLGNTLAIDVNESQKKIYALAQGKLWQLPMK